MMEKRKWLNSKTIGWVLIVVGTIAVMNTLFPVYLYQVSREWQSTQGRLTSNKILGMFLHFRRLLTYEYVLGTEKLNGSQIMPRDKWVDDLKEGDTIPLRYRNAQDKLAVVDHQQTCESVLLACWNGAWILAGAIILYRERMKRLESAE